MVLLQKLFILSLFVLGISAKPKVFNVKKHGAVPDGKTDNTQIFLQVWKDACKVDGGAIIAVPKGTFLIGVTVFQGTCKGRMDFQIRGTLKAPTNLAFLNDTWIKFAYTKELNIGGGGTLDGVGASAWPYNDCKTNPHCRDLPPNLRFDFVNDSTINDIHSINSKSRHINVFACVNVTFNSITITAPSDSPNTDGVHIGRSSSIGILHSIIGTGDDCISFSPGCNNIYVNDVTCGPGHGISIGSLGRNNNEPSVEGLIVKNCTFIGTTNGARIKTWAPSNSSLIQNITFEDIIMNNVQNPIVIDQNYCPHHKCDPKSYSSVIVKDVHYIKVRGTSASKVAVNFICSKKYPCKGIELNDIVLSSTKRRESTSSYCLNVKGKAIGMQSPPCCFSNRNLKVKF